MSRQTVRLYVELAPDRSKWDPEYLYGAKVRRVLKRRPKVLTPDTVLVKILIELDPEKQFNPTVSTALL